MGRAKLTGLWNRAYADFLMPSRLPSYRQFLEEALRRDYTICSVDSFWNKIQRNEISHGEKYLVLRHDIDTDTDTAKMMWRIDQSLAVKSSYYFRLSTLDISFMQDIVRSGGEASYHYEELAQVAKEKHLKTRDQVLCQMPYIRDLFHRNLETLKKNSGLPLDIVASHGDFVNRKLRMYNWEILQDEDFRKRVGVKLEVYDEAFLVNVTSRHSDTLHPIFWKPENPLQAVKAAAPVIYVLVHPRHWQINRKVNLADDVCRLVQGVRYSLQ
jgi:hypothetical protein